MSDPEQKPNLAQKGKGSAKWEDKHTDILVAGIISLVMEHRTELYQLDGIIGEVDGHGNDKTSRCVTRLLKAFAAANNVSEDVVNVNKKRKAAKTDNAKDKKAKRTP